MADSRKPDAASRLGSARRFAGLVSGPGWYRSYQRQQTVPIDGTNAKLRDPTHGSPFTISVVPPDLLLEAIREEGEGVANRDGIYDPKLREVFRAAEETFQTTLDLVIAEGVADPFSDLRVLQAREALAGGRAPNNSAQNINIIDASLRSTNQFGATVNREKKFRESNLFATGRRREKSLNALETLIGINGIEFKPQNVTQSAANQGAVSDLNQALSVLVQLNRMTVTPPLTMLVNPETMSISYQKKQQYQDRSRFNYIFQSWGEEQVRLSFAARTAGFVAGSSGQFALQTAASVGESTPLDPQTPVRTNTVSGYQWASKRDSAAWQNLMSLFTMYRNNAYIYNELDRSEAHLWVGHVQIAYDQMIYLGQFENFSYGYSEDKQNGSVDFKFDFVASFMYDLSQGGGQKPVRPIPSVTPSPSDPQWIGESRGPLQLASQLTNTTRETQGTDGGDTSTAIMNPVIGSGLGNQELLEEDEALFRGLLNF